MNTARWDTPQSLEARDRMIAQQLTARGIRDERVLAAVRRVPREAFLAENMQEYAYEDKALPIEQGQTISQPFIVAYMTEALAVQPAHRVLEIGTGSGYQCAVLAQLAAHVFTVERVTELHADAQRVLAEFELSNITFAAADGTMGLPAHAPYDGIIVTAGAPHVPPSLVHQLADGGRLVLPVGDRKSQRLVCIVRHGSRTVETPLIGCRFVSLIGTEGWPEE